MVNYDNGKIYKLVRLTDDVVVYVGSTCETALCRRLAKHKDKAIRCPNRKVYKSINENGGWENHQIILIEHCNCNSKDELHKKEREFIVSLKPIGNIVIPLRTLAEWRIENKEIIKQNKKEYHIENKAKLNQKSKQYHIDNKAKSNQMSKQYKIENKEKLEQKILCQCGRTYAYQSKSRHNKSKFHINNTPKPVVNIV